MAHRLEQAETSYERLLAQCAKTPFEATDMDRRLTVLINDEPFAELETKSQRVFFVKRVFSNQCLSYRVFRTQLSAIIGEEAIGSCVIGTIAEGIWVIRSAEVARSHQRKGIATAVYDLIISDMAKIGGLLWPVSPKKMTDAEFKVWWRRSPALVFYYPHRHTLGLAPRPEFEVLFDDTLNRGICAKALSYLLAFMTRVRRTSSIGLRQ